MMCFAGECSPTIWLNEQQIQIGVTEHPYKRVTKLILIL